MKQQSADKGCHKADEEVSRTIKDYLEKSIWKKISRKRFPEQEVREHKAPE